eukprot:Seg653.2 transcript_id=Seg653.2/GoldUCD/mRNA.D3Y31 product="hypothetical protein" protein_id=Seg653.2/GoldUCD/D3Y31
MKLIQSSSMANSQTSMQAALTGATQLSVATSQGIGITSVPNPQHIIKGQQNIAYQLQRSQASTGNLVTTQSIINAQLLGQQNVQLVASNPELVISQGGIVAASTSSGNISKSTAIAGTKQQMISRTQPQIRPTLQTVNITGASIAANGASLSQQPQQQSQLRMMGMNVLYLRYLFSCC